MRRNLYILLGLLAVVFAAGCSKLSDDEIPVPVQFLVSTIDAKASIDSPDDLEGAAISVFAFDKEAQNILEDDGFNMRNAKATYKIEQGLYFQNTRYYPTSGDAEFNFYSCYPVQGYTETETDALAAVSVTSIRDVIWAKADEVDGGYNAKYMREGGRLPIFKYKHKTARILFEACVDITNTDVTLMHIGLVDQPTMALLNVRTGEFDSYYEISPRSLVRKIGNDDSGNLDLKLTTEYQKACQPVFICPKYSDGLEADIGVQIGGNAEVKWFRVNLDSENKGFIEGHSYTIKIIVKAPSDISFVVKKETSDDVSTQQPVLDFDGPSDPDNPDDTDSDGYQWEDVFGEY